MNTEGDLLVKSLQKEVIRYNKRFSEKSGVDSSLFKKISEKLSILIYKIGLHSSNLESDDSADFLLFMFPHFENLIVRYNPKSGEFINYLRSALSKKMITFYKINAKKQAKSSMLELCNFDFSEGLVDNQDDYVLKVSESPYSKEKTIALRKLQYITRNSITAKKRLFLYVFSISPSLSSNFVESFCEAFNYDVMETLDLVQQLRILRYEDKNIKELEEKRNIAWERKLLIEDRKQKYSYCEDHSKDNYFLNQIERLDEIFKSENLEIREKMKIATRNEVEKILGVTEGTVASAMRFVKNIIDLCVNDYKPSLQKSYGLHESIITAIKDGSWENSYEPANEKYFSPVIEFHIH